MEVMVTFAQLLDALTASHSLMALAAFELKEIDEILAKQLAERVQQNAALIRDAN